jgi:hypothetical protein
MKRLSPEECLLVERKIEEIEEKARELLDLINGKVYAPTLDRLLETFNGFGKRGFQRFKIAIEDEMYRVRFDSFRKGGTP